MGKTRRRQPVSHETKRQRLEREWERQVQQAKIPSSASIEDQEYVLPSPPGIESIRKEAELIVNQRLGTEDTYLETERARQRTPYSVQAPATDEPREIGGGLVFWSGGTLDEYIPLHQYGDPQRQRDLRTFALLSPMILNAESILTKKVQALQWTIQGGRNLALKWQQRLNNFENGDGWDMFVARWVRAYSESDKPACAELIRAAPAWAVDNNYQLTPRGQRAIERGDDKAWEIVDARIMDPINVFPTTSREFPIVYQNPYTGKRHRIRSYQYMFLTDLPAVDDRYPGMGVCSVSRAVWAAQEDRMIVRYSMEKFSENPGAGLAVMNVSATSLRTAFEQARAEREARGVVYYKGIIFMPVLDPTGSTKMEFLSFSEAPEGWDRAQVYSIIKEVIATSFGLDVLELGSIPGRLGTATQAKVAAQKGRTKSIGAIMQGIERAFRYKLLPPSITFEIKKHDQEEEHTRAEIDAIYFENAIRYAQFAPPQVAMQYLVDKGAVPNEPPYSMQLIDLTGKEEIQDVEPEEVLPSEDSGQPQATSTPAAEGPEGAAERDIVKRWKREGPRIRVTNKGHIEWIEPTYAMVVNKQVQRLTPLVGGSIPIQDSTITPADIDRANARFNRLFPEYDGLLEATRV